MNYIIIATPTKAGQPTQYVAGTRGSGYLTEDINEAARFVQATSTQAAIRDLRTKNLERRLGVSLSYGRIQTTVVETFDTPAPPTKVGYIIKFENDDRNPYSTCPRKPKDLTFSHVHYSRSANIDKATRYPTLEEAQTRVDQMLKVLKDAAEAMTKQPIYQKLVDDFKATIQKV